MKLRLLPLFLFLILACHKDIMQQQGFNEVKNFDWNVIEEENKLNIKYWLIDSPVDTITTLVVRVKIEGIDLENIFKNPTIKIDNSENSAHIGTKCIEEDWIPALAITKTNIEEIHLYVKK